MKEQVMIYEVKSSASSNANLLFSNDNNYFYWNDLTFRFLKDKDYVIVVNQTEKWVLFTQFLEEKIPTELDEKKLISSFTHRNKLFQPVAPSIKKLRQWKNFIHLSIHKKISIPNNWKWKSLGSSETTYLNGRIDSSNSNRIININQLKELYSDAKYQEILEKCMNNFKEASKPNKKGKTIKKQRKMEYYSNILTAIQTKPFIILAGISGTGKSRLVRELAFKSCNNETLRKESDNKPGNYELIPVKPNWHDSSDLLGYITRIDGEKYIATSFVKFIAKAWKYPNTPFFLCLDEMNLAPVEQYFAEYLSIIETRNSKDGKVETDAILDIKTIGKENIEPFLKELKIDRKIDKELYADFKENGIKIPNNLVVMGTVNMDESTHSFSRKVLDRAMTIEMNNVDLNAGLDIEQDDLSYPNKYLKYNDIIGNKTKGAEVYKEFKQSDLVLEYLEQLNFILEGSPFKIAYRVRDEFLIFSYHHLNKGGDIDIALDQLTFMKVLSRIEGDEVKVRDILDKLSVFFSERDLNLSKAKVEEMLNRLEFGYTSFWS